MHGTTGSGKQFDVEGFAGELFGKGQLLDAEKYYIIMPDDIGHGESSKPSDGLHAKFPNYRYADMIDAEYKLVTDGLKVNHLRLVMGTSMGGMHTWLWGETYPDFMDALMPLASLPEQISGRNRMWRQMASDAIRLDPEWKDGEYTSQPRGLHLLAEVMYFMGDNPARRYRPRQPVTRRKNCWKTTPTESYEARCQRHAVRHRKLARLRPGPGVEKITAPLLAINSADDLINPPDLGILERQIKRVKNGKAITIPESLKLAGTARIRARWFGNITSKNCLKQTEH